METAGRPYLKSLQEHDQMLTPDDIEFILQCMDKTQFTGLTTANRVIQVAGKLGAMGQNARKEKESEEAVVQE